MKFTNKGDTEMILKTMVIAMVFCDDAMVEFGGANDQTVRTAGAEPGCVPGFVSLQADLN